MQKRERIAEFINSLNIEKTESSIMLVGGKMNGGIVPLSTSNSGGCYNTTTFSCSASTNKGGCVNTAGACDNAKNSEGCNNGYNPNPGGSNTSGIACLKP